MTDEQSHPNLAQTTEHWPLGLLAMLRETPEGFYTQLAIGSDLAAPLNSGRELGPYPSRELALAGAALSLAERL